MVGIALAVGASAVFVTSRLVERALRRRSEFVADAIAVNRGGADPGALASSLRKVANSVQSPPGTRSGRIVRLLNRYPPIEARIDRLPGRE